MSQENAVAAPGTRTGMYPTGWVAQREGHEIGWYFSGRANAEVSKHGENAGALVQQREPTAGPLLLMSDALSANRLEPTPPVEVVVCFCLAHGLRKFSDFEEAFPQPCTYVLGVWDQVFEHDQAARECRLSAEARLTYHQQHSGPLRDALHGWLEQQLEDREVEPNSALGKAFNYLLGHWTELTQFLRVAGAPLDSNVVERALKLMIRQRNNSLFFTSAYSAQVGSVIASPSFYLRTGFDTSRASALKVAGYQLDRRVYRETTLGVFSCQQAFSCTLHRWKIRASNATSSTL